MPSQGDAWLLPALHSGGNGGEGPGEVPSKLTKIRVF
jgi:hypothetical protein